VGRVDYSWVLFFMVICLPSLEAMVQAWVIPYESNRIRVLVELVRIFVAVRAGKWSCL
jgi:hypothetical protein